MNANTGGWDETGASGGHCEGMGRRGMIGMVAGVVGGTAVAAAAGAAGGTGQSGGREALRRVMGPGWDAATNQYVLPALGYAPEALEPHLDAQTMTIHHGTHHAAYVKGANAALAALAAIRDGGEDAKYMKHWSRELAFHASGHFNHTLFWMTMAAAGKGGGGKPEGELGSAIDRDFGSFDKFSAHFKSASVSVEGSGWGWLAYQPMSGKLLVIQGEKQQDVTVWGVVPLLGLDVWEHAYYLKYQSKRAAYADAFFQVINWGKVGELYAAAKG